MGIFDALKGLFGGGWPRNKQSYNSNDNQKIPPSNSFIKPDWANEDEDSDDDLAMEFKNGQIKLFKPNKESSSSSSTQIYTLPPPQNNKPQVFSSQVFTKVVRRADGSTEEIRTKQIGDQKYTKIVRTDPQGQMTIHEDIVNIDEDKLKDFQSVGETPLPRIDFKDWFKFRL
uniref:Uncharacterized protein n=1 Tax=Cacopsylla melanoneura TaxID=428564 RepID=A0A8D8SJ37_9HEMI